MYKDHEPVKSHLSFLLNGRNNVRNKYDIMLVENMHQHQYAPICTCVKDLPGKQKHPLLRLHPDHQQQGGQQAGERQDLGD